MYRYVKKKCEDRFTDCKHTNYFETFFSSHLYRLQKYLSFKYTSRHSVQLIS